MTLPAIEVSLLWRLPGDGVLLLIPFDHRQGQRGAHDILAQGPARILVVDPCAAVDGYANCGFNRPLSRNNATSLRRQISESASLAPGGMKKNRS